MVKEFKFFLNDKDIEKQITPVKMKNGMLGKDSGAPRKKQVYSK